MQISKMYLNTIKFWIFKGLSEFWCKWPQNYIFNDAGLMMHWESGIFKVKTTEIYPQWSCQWMRVSMGEQTCLTCSQSRTQCWGQHLAQSKGLHSHLLSEFMKQWIKPCQQLLLDSALSWSSCQIKHQWVMESCHNCSSKGTLAGSEWHSAKSSTVLTFAD